MLTFTIGNANPGALTNVGFTDGLPSSPAQLVIANSPAATSSGCGAATLTATPGASTITLAGATVAANSTCTIGVHVRAPAAPLVGTYANTTGPLSVNGTATGLTASSTLTVASAPAGTGVCGLTVAQWDFGTAAAPTLTVSTVGAGVGTATIGQGNGLTTATDTTQGSPAASSMKMYGWQNVGPINTATSDYVEFAIDTDSYTGVALQFNAIRANPGPSTNEIWYSTNGGTSWTQKATFNATTVWAAYGPYDFTGQTNTSGTTLFRIYGFGANNENIGAYLNVDQVTFTGCGAALQPTLTKAFSPNPITVGGTSTLTFTLTNPNTAPLTGAKFLDALPTGLQVAPSVSAVTTCGGFALMGACGRRHCVGLWPDDGRDTSRERLPARLP